jgi:hypothetical protein
MTEELSAHSLVWAMQQVIGHADEPMTQEESDDAFQTEIAQAKADAAAAGCPDEELDMIGHFMAIYMSQLKSYTELFVLELVEASNVNRTKASLFPIIEQIADSVRGAGACLNRPPAFVEVDLADAADKAHDMYQEVMVLAHTHRDLGDG